MGWFSAGQLAVLTARNPRVALLAEFRFQGDTKRVWNGDRWLKIGADVYQPLRGRGFIDQLPVQALGTTESVNTSLPGVDSSIVALAFAATADIVQRVAILSLQFFDKDWAPVGSPLGVFFGFMQPPRATTTIMQGVEGPVKTISMEILNMFFNRSKPPYGRYDDADQEARSTGDRFFAFVTDVADKNVTYPDY